MASNTQHKRPVAWCTAWLMAVVTGMLTMTGPAGAADAASDALTRLKTGNTRFVANASEALPITAPRRTALAQGQSPFATVLSCSDSRVPPEVIFHAGLGDLFVVRSAGHVSDRSVLASLEYGAEQLRTPLLVVMGHESCGVVKAAMDATPAASAGPNLAYVLKAIRPAVARASGEAAHVRLRAAILANVEETINGLLESSTVLKGFAEGQRLTLVGAYYELATGRAHFSEPVRLIPRPTAAAGTSTGSRTGGSATKPPPAAKPSAAKPPAATKPAASDVATKPISTKPVPRPVATAPAAH